MLNNPMLASELSRLEPFLKTRQTSIKLCEPLTTEDHVVQPIVDVSPPKWHLAHTTWFFETFLLTTYQPNYQPFHPQYSYLFNSYYQTVGDRCLRNRRGFMTRPRVTEIVAYREFVDKHLISLIDSSIPKDERFYQILELGIHHEQQHQELLITDLKYILGLNPLYPVYQDTLNGESLPFPEPDSTAPQWIHIAEGVYDIGHPGNDFCYDNELGRHRVYLHEFEISDRLITNRQYLEFMAAGGYDRFELWLDAGWSWQQTQAVRSPLYWHHIDGNWFEFTLAGLRPLNLDAPVVHVSYYEADAFARWAGKRLPTEFEWEVAANRLQVVDRRDRGNFLDSGWFHPLPQDPANQWLGTVWEWTSSAYLPYPYFAVQPGAIGEYNGKFMSDQWVLRGGSCATDRNHIRTTYRNFFPADKQWQFSGIRLASHC
jgi:ergothioneine biosynthesis protein EgtB